MTPDPASTPHDPGPLADDRLGAVLAAIAGPKPVPAAGAALAVTLGIAAALLEKAASAASDGVPVDSSAQGRAKRLRNGAIALADEEAAAHRSAHPARAQAADLVLAMAEIGVTLARLADRIHDRVPLSLQGEVRCAVRLACAAVRAAAELVAIDLGELSGDRRETRAYELAAEAAAHARTLAERPLRAR